MNFLEERILKDGIVKEGNVLILIGSNQALEAIQ